MCVQGDCGCVRIWGQVRGGEKSGCEWTHPVVGVGWWEGERSEGGCMHAPPPPSPFSP